MTFSIIIPTYNGSRYVEQAILSVLSQTRPADEIIISDDNSSDNTIDICNKYEDKIKIFKNANGPSGFVNGWNNAIALASCDYISIIHQDDLLAPNFLENIEKALQLFPDIKHLFVPCNNIDEHGNVFSEPSFCDGCTKRYSGAEYVRAYQTIGDPHIHRCPGVITHKSIFEICRYREEAGHIADDDFFYRVGQYTDIVGIMKPLASYRVHRFSETGHLEDVVLVKRLLRDYLFQVQEMNNNTCLNNDAKEYFRYWHRRYFYRLLASGFKRICMSDVLYAIRHLW